MLTHYFLNRLSLFLQDMVENAGDADQSLSSILNSGVEVKSFVVQEDGSVVEQAVDSSVIQQVLANQINQVIILTLWSQCY